MFVVAVFSENILEISQIFCDEHFTNKDFVLFGMEKKILFSQMFPHVRRNMVPRVRLHIPTANTATD